MTGNKNHKVGVFPEKITCLRVNPEVAVLCSQSFSHFSGVTCLATKLWVDLISGNASAQKIQGAVYQIITRLTSFQEYLDSIKNLITYHDKFVKIGGIQGEQSFAGLENTVNAKTGFKGTLDVDKHVERFAGNVTPYQNSNLNFTDKTKNSAQFF